MDNRENRSKIEMTDARIIKINEILAKGDRVEVIPVKDGVKVIHIRRKEVKLNIDKIIERCKTND